MSKPQLSLYDYYHSLFEAVVADTDHLREECYKIRYQVYCIENDWERGAHKNPLHRFERDGYDDHSVHALLRHKQSGHFVGTVRLILHPDHATKGVFPIHKLCEQNKIQLPETVPLQNLVEVSRFCISRELRRRITDTARGTSYSADYLAFDPARAIPSMSLGLISMLVLLSKQNNVQGWCCEMEPFLIQILAKMGIHFDPIGPMIEFHGQRQICHKPLDELLARVQQERPEVWDIITNKGQFLEGSEQPQFNLVAVG